MFSYATAQKRELRRNEQPTVLTSSATIKCNANNASRHRFEPLWLLCSALAPSTVHRCTGGCTEIRNTLSMVSHRFPFCAFSTRNQIQPNKPNQTRPDQPEPNRTRPDQSNAIRTKPYQTKPNQTQPNSTKPNEVKPN